VALVEPASVWVLFLNNSIYFYNKTVKKGEREVMIK
jgi:hypothetical protein